MIEQGLPGAGNILVFDNGSGTGYAARRRAPGRSSIQEIDPVTKSVVWSYSDGFRFWSNIVSGAQRLPNGNTFICSGVKGRMFEVKPDGAIVWEYVNRGGTTRPSVVPYDFTPQLRAMPQPEEKRVTPPNNLEWQLLPDVDRNP